MTRNETAWPTADFAGTGARFAALVIDQLLALLVVIVGYAVVAVGLVTDSGPLLMVGLVATGVLPLVYLLLVCWRHGAAGVTPGKKVLGLRTADAESRRPIGFGRAFLRQLVLGLPGPVNVVQLFTIGSHPRRQGWHDRAVRSVVLDLRRSVETAPPLSRPVAPAPPSLATGTPMAPPSSLIPPVSPSAAAPAAPPMTPPMTPAVPAAVPPAAPAPPPPPPAVSVPAPAAPAAPAAAALVVPPPPGVPQPAAVPPPAEPPAEQHAPPAVAWRVRAAGGAVCELTGQVLVGRDPAADLVPGATAWSVDDPALSVSKTHALLGIGTDGPWVEDWHSTNGVRLRRDGLTSTLGPHNRTTLRAADEVLLGDFVLTVEVGQ